MNRRLCPHGQTLVTLNQAAWLLYTLKTQLLKIQIYSQAAFGGWTQFEDRCVNQKSDWQWMGFMWGANWISLFVQSLGTLYFTWLFFMAEKRWGVREKKQKRWVLIDISLVDQQTTTCFSSIQVTSCTPSNNDWLPVKEQPWQHQRLSEKKTSTNEIKKVATMVCSPHLPASGQNGD